MGSIIVIKDPVIARRVCSLAAANPSDATTHRILDYATDVDGATALRTHDADLLAELGTRTITLLDAQTISVTEAISWGNWIDVSEWAHISWTVRNDGPNALAIIYWRMALDNQGTGSTGYQSTSFPLAVSSARSWYDNLPPGTNITPTAAREPMMAPALQFGFQCTSLQTASVDLRVYGTERRR